MKTKIILLLICIALVSCNTEVLADKKIKKTVTSFLDAVEKRDTEKYNDLIYESDLYSGAVHRDRIFFYNNYDKINSIVDLKKNIKIKDTIHAGAKCKYVQYHIKYNNFSKPLIITFIFYKPVGYNKIFYPGIFQNMTDWKDYYSTKQ